MAPLALTTVPKAPTTAPKKKREQIQMLERRPAEDWFVVTKTPRGGTKVYLRFQVTGMYPRLFGPFPSKRKALLFLDAALGNLSDFWTEADEVREQYANEAEFEYISWGPLIEHPLVQKGR